MNGITDSGQRTAIPFEATIKLNRPAYARKQRDCAAIALRPLRGIVAPAVSPNGRSVAFTALGDLWLQEHGNAAVRLTNDVFVQAQPRWSPDATMLIYVSELR